MRWIAASEQDGAPVHVGVDANGALWISQHDQPQCLGAVAQSARASGAGAQVRIELADGRVLHSEDWETLSAWFEGLRPRRKVRSPLTITLVMCAALVLAFYLVIRFVVPTLGDWAAGWIPQSFEQQLKEPVRQSLQAQGLLESKLPEGVQLHYRKLFEQFTAQMPEAERRRYALEFRSFAEPNAFAMPGGVIVFTDPIFALFEDDEQFLAVLAHEIGHVDQRHIVRSLLRSSTLTLVSAVVFGDVGSALAVADTVPGLLLHSAYSRDFEREADTYAFAALKARGLSPRALGRFLKKLGEHAGGDAPGVLRYAASHPATAERIEAAEAASR